MQSKNPGEPHEDGTSPVPVAIDLDAFWSELVFLEARQLPFIAGDHASNTDWPTVFSLPRSRLHFATGTVPEEVQPFRARSGSRETLHGTADERRTVTTPSVFRRRKLAASSCFLLVVNLATSLAKRGKTTLGPIDRPAGEPGERRPGVRPGTPLAVGTPRRATPARIYPFIIAFKCIVSKSSCSTRYTSEIIVGRIPSARLLFATKTYGPAMPFAIRCWKRTYSPCSSSTGTRAGIRSERTKPPPPPCRGCVARKRRPTLDRSALTSSGTRKQNRRSEANFSGLHCSGTVQRVFFY